jgi:hypothetical protein
LKHFILVTILIVIGSIVACGTPPDSPIPTVDANTATVLPAISTPTSIPAQNTSSNGGEIAEIRDLVTNFGKRLQDVSLLAPDAAQEIQNQYSKFVSPSLLELWMNDISKAPGRRVSSPWPDHIEITTFSKEDSDSYELTGYVIEVTSAEVVNGGAAARIPVRMIVQKNQGHWYITDYKEER